MAPAVSVAGTITLSHANGSGFWQVSRFRSISTKFALSTLTVIATAIGVRSFALCWLFYALLS